jgi:cytochrome P450
MTSATPALRGPKPRFLIGNIAEYGPDPLGFMTRCAREYGDLVPIKFGPFTAHLATSPALVEEVLATRARDFRKSLGTRLLKPLVGNGLLTAEGDFWLKQRRLAQPAFHRERVAAYGRTMVDFTQEHVDRWQVGRELDLHAELMALAYRIVVKVLFDAELEGRVADVAAANAGIQRHLEQAFNTFRFLLPDWLPTPGNIRYRRWVRRLDDVVYAIIRERKTESTAAGDKDDRGDLLSILLAARDEEGRPMSDRQVRDEVMTLMLAGHETTALALSWAFMLLGQNPDAERRLQQELATVLGGRTPTPADVPALKFTEAVINETMRLYPPAYTTGREAIRETQVGGIRFPRRGVVLVAQWVTHRDPRWFDQPDSFRPERWLDGLARRLPRGAFYPFGLGPRKCIGADFAMLEATLLLATVAQRRRFELVPGQTFEPQPAVTLRPRDGLRAIAQAAQPERPLGIKAVPTREQVPMA